MPETDKKIKPFFIELKPLPKSSNGNGANGHLPNPDRVFRDFEFKNTDFQLLNELELQLEQKPKEHIYLQCLIGGKKEVAKIWDQKAAVYVPLRLPKDIESGTVIQVSGRSSTEKLQVIKIMPAEDEFGHVVVQVSPPRDTWTFIPTIPTNKPVRLLEDILEEYPEQIGGKLTTAEIKAVREEYKTTTQTFKSIS